MRTFANVSRPKSRNCGMAAKEQACAERMLKDDDARATCAHAGCGTKLQKPLLCARCKAVTYCSKGKCSCMLAMSLCVPGLLIPSLWFHVVCGCKRACDVCIQRRCTL